MSTTDEERKQFLKEDLYNTLRYLFEGAIAWYATKQTGGQVIFHHQGVLGMYTTFMEARALYEFFHNHSAARRFKDEARADDFATGWRAKKSHVYERYMAAGMPANKRMFHLVYGRSGHSGGTGTEGVDHLNKQVLIVAKDLRDLTEEFVNNMDRPMFQGTARAALKNALNEAQKAAEHYNIANPLS